MVGVTRGYEPPAEYYKLSKELREQALELARTTPLSIAEAVDRVSSRQMGKSSLAGAMLQEYVRALTPPPRIRPYEKPSSTLPAGERNVRIKRKKAAKKSRKKNRRG